MVLIRRLLRVHPHGQVIMSPGEADPVAVEHASRELRQAAAAARVLIVGDGGRPHARAAAAFGAQPARDVQDFLGREICRG